jgi:hypothetical protein
VPQAGKYPRELMEWAGSTLSPAFEGWTESPMRLREHDFCVGEHKIAGNAQGEGDSCLQVAVSIRVEACSNVSRPLGASHVLALGV